MNKDFKQELLKCLRYTWLSLVALVLLTLFSIPVITINLFIRRPVSKYLFALAIGLDQLGGSILYAQPDWTVSSRTYYLAEKKNRKPAKIFMACIDFLFGKYHCQRSYIWEKKVNKSENAFK